MLFMLCVEIVTLVVCIIPDCSLNIRWSFWLLFCSEVNGRTLLRLLIRDAAGQTENMLLSEYAPQWITDIVVQVILFYCCWICILSHNTFTLILNQNYKLVVCPLMKKESVTSSAMYSKCEFCYDKACARTLDWVVSQIYTRFWHEIPFDFLFFFVLRWFYYVCKWKKLREGTFLCQQIVI